MKKSLLLASLAVALVSRAQVSPVDSSLFMPEKKDSLGPTMNMDAIYRRPFLNQNKVPVALGGYAEAVWQHQTENGVTQGNQLEFRRLSLFMASTISRRIKFLSEIEFEYDADEIAEGEGLEIGIEYAAMDIELHHLINVRSGIILNPIGAFNQNHDGPKWEFNDRPISATQLLPATWSATGFGIYGKQYTHRGMVGYELYISNGFNDLIIDNENGKTYIPAAKGNANQFVKSASGSPSFTGKIAGRLNSLGEVGLSYMGGVYNTYRIDGVTIDNKRWCQIAALDWNMTIQQSNTALVGEWAEIWVQLPDAISPEFGSHQRGGFLDVIQPVYKLHSPVWKNAVINLACRLEYVDWNVGTFVDTQGNKADELISFMPAISFRPTPQTCIRFNYRMMQHHDVFANPATNTSTFSLGISSYF